MKEYKCESTERKRPESDQVKHIYDKRIVARKFQPAAMVLLWNARLEKKGKCGKFDPI